MHGCPESPPEQIRKYLTPAKRQGVEFDTAWRFAVQRTRFPHDRTHRHQWYRVIDEMRAVFERAYRDEHVPGGEAALSLLDAIGAEGARYDGAIVGERVGVTTYDDGRSASRLVA